MIPWTTERSPAIGLGPAATIAVRGWAKVSSATFTDDVPNRMGRASASRAAQRFVDGRPLLNRWKAMKEIPATSRESDAFSKDLKQRGFSFVGSTVIYAHMQAVGMVNDHLVDCFRYREVQRPD